MKQLAISPLSLNQYSRDLWGQFDPLAIAQLSPLADDPCYQPKLYKAPAEGQEVVAAYDYVTYGLKITPGSLVYGFYLACNAVPGAGTWISAPPQFNVQITDANLDHKLFDDPVPSVFLANAKSTFQSITRDAIVGSTPNLLCTPHPIVGNRPLLIELWEASGAAQRIELVLGVLEVCR